MFAHDWLLAVLVRLSDDPGAPEGRWFLETGYGRFAQEQPVFTDMAAAESWFRARLADTRPDDPWLN